MCYVWESWSRVEDTRLGIAVERLLDTQCNE